MNEMNGMIADIEPITVGEARAWMVYMQGVGGDGETDLFGGVALGAMTLHELCYWFPELTEDQVEETEHNELAALADRFMEVNSAFCALRARLVEAGEQVIRNVSPGGTD